MHRFAAQAIIALSIILFGGSFLLFGSFIILGPFTIFRFDGPEVQLLIWDGFISIVFFIQHSVMVRKSFKSWLSSFIQSHYQGMTFSILSSMVLSFTVLLWQPSNTIIFQFPLQLKLLPHAMVLIAISGFLWGIVSLKVFDPFGITPILSDLGSKKRRSPGFVIRGTANGGTIILGKKFPELRSDEFYPLCSEFYRQLEKRVHTPNCGLVHGGHHLTRNFRRAVLTGTPLKCMAILKNGAEILDKLALNVTRGEMNFLNTHDMEAIQRITNHFESYNFHCCQSVIETVHKKTGLNIDAIRDASRGFIGDIGLNGTVCGALLGGVLCMGLQENVDLRNSGYSDTVRIILHGLIKNDRIFEDEKRFLPARLYNRCRSLYLKIQDTFGGPHCRKIIARSLDTQDGAYQYIETDRLSECRKIVDSVVENACT
ncbi:MAG: C-GCAxxG-C-C family protein [Proteobacteria bacterium]|nr:C-GCAxxG-C-C family protein [Pseudomonadota bacterium]